jgi:hypothetical protein
MPADQSRQNDASRSPLYERAKAVVDAYYGNPMDDDWHEAVADCVNELREELARIDLALQALDDVRRRLP